MPSQIDEKPCLVEARQGFCVLYKNRFLYSKYNPEKLIMAKISSLNILPGTLILAFSPCLCLGIKELCKILPKDCLILGCEYDDKLFNFTKKYLPQECNNFIMLEKNELENLPYTLLSKNAITTSGATIGKLGNFRRVMRIDFSNGIQFFSQSYNLLFDAVQNSISSIWKNRITLVKLGRRFSRNMFRNIAKLPREVPIQNISKKISKPIIVFGAGESMEETAKKIKHKQNMFFKIAVDTSISTLLSFGIDIDAVVCEEGQSVIANAFLCNKEKSFHIFAGITSWHHSTDITNGNISFFATQYCDTLFFDKLVQQKIFTTVMNPLGSVGLVATKIALMLRSSTSIPIFITGLDFSYSCGKTHARGTPAHIKQLISTNRLLQIENYTASFSYGAKKVISKTGISFSSIILLSYAHLFQSYFSKEINIFDVGKLGVNLGIKLGEKELLECLNKCDTETNKFKEILSYKYTNADICNITKKIKSFYEEEKNALTELKAILSSGQNIEETERNKKITELILKREYLYLHFPDGFEVKLEQSFLKRVRAEIDFFLKDIQIGLNSLK